jgi:hypothetical protein
MDAIAAKFKAQSRHFPGGTDENHEIPQSDEQVFGPKFEPRTSRTRIRISNHSATTFRLNSAWADYTKDCQVNLFLICMKSLFIYFV